MLLIDVVFAPSKCSLKQCGWCPRYSRLISYLLILLSVNLIWGNFSLKVSFISFLRSEGFTYSMTVVWNARSKIYHLSCEQDWQPNNSSKNTDAKANLSFIVDNLTEMSQSWIPTPDEVLKKNSKHTFTRSKWQHEDTCQVGPWQGTVQAQLLVFFLVNYQKSHNFFFLEDIFFLREALYRRICQGVSPLFRYTGHSPCKRQRWEHAYVFHRATEDHPEDLDHTLQLLQLHFLREWGKHRGSPDKGL